MVSVLPETVAVPPLLLLEPHADTTAASTTRHIPAANQRARKVFSLLMDLTTQTATRDPIPLCGGTPSRAGAEVLRLPGALEHEPAADQPVRAETGRDDVAAALDRVAAEHGPAQPRGQRGGRHRLAIVRLRPGAVEGVDRDPHGLVPEQRPGRHR